MTRPWIAITLFMMMALGGCQLSAPAGSVKTPYPTASEVRLFVETDYKDGKIVFSKPAGRLLSANERTQFEKALFVTKAPEEVAACFIPHHFFRYFDRQGKQVGEIAVCFCCAGVEANGASNIAIGFNQILSADFGQLKKLVHALGEPTDVEC